MTVNKSSDVHTSINWKIKKNQPTDYLRQALYISMSSSAMSPFQELPRIASNTSYESIKLNK